MRTTIQKSWYRNGLLREEMPLRNGQRHGIARVWHKNGRLASEDRYANGLLHGVCRQWSESGRLLGKYRMVQGTGVQRAWHDNGRPQMELSTVRGEFCGRSRSWLSDGTLVSDDIYLLGKLVGVDEYRAAAAKDKSLPKLGRAAVKGVKPVSEKHIHRVFVAALLAKPNRFEACAWLDGKRTDRAARLLGRFKRESDAAKFVASLYDAGATAVIVPDIYRNEAGDLLADGLFVRLPKAPAKRKAIRKVCTQLQERKLGAVQPDADIGESHLFLSMT
ncbi:MAG: toxin-antitoxin system YwqK family antitoxin [Verrucomicrobiia bacterium]